MQTQSRLERFFLFVKDLLQNWFFIVLAGLVILHLSLLKRDLWQDEFNTFFIVKDGFSDVVYRSTNRSFQSPFYFVLVWCFSQIFGFSEPSLRFLSFSFVLLSLVFLYRLTKRYYDRETAQLTSLIYYCVNIVVLASVSARPYGLSLFLVVLSFYFLDLWMSEGRFLYQCVYIMLSGLILHTQYIFFPVYLVQLVFFYFMKKKGSRISWWRIGVSFLVIGAFVLPLIPIIRQMWNHRLSWSWLPTPKFNHLFEVFPPYTLQAFVGFLVFILFRHFFAQTGTQKFWHDLTATTETKMAFFLFLIPPAALFCISQLTHAKIFYPRYYMPWCIGFSLLFGRFLRNYGGNIGKFISVSVFVGLMILDAVFKTNVNHQEWNKAKDKIHQLIQDNEQDVLYSSELIEADEKTFYENPLFKEAFMIPLQYYQLEGNYKFIPRIPCLAKNREYAKKIFAGIKKDRFLYLGTGIRPDKERCIEDFAQLHNYQLDQSFHMKGRMVIMAFRRS